MARLAGRAGISELVLIDPDPARLDVVGPFSARIMRAAGHPAQLRWTADLDDGLDGAGAVLLQLRIGGQAARQRDETWPLEYGCVGQETTGAGGFAKALRTVPVVLDIAERARRRAAAGAWIIDFTNPVGIVTRALLDAGHRAVGLCNVAIGFQRSFAAMLGRGPGPGLARPRRPEPPDLGTGGPGQRAGPAPGAAGRPWRRDRGQDRQPAGVLQELGAVPSYYLRYFYCHDAVVAEQRRRATRAEEVARLERELLALYADPALDRKPELLGERGGAYYSEAAVALLVSLVTDRRDTQVVNVRNAGTMPFLPDEAVIEVPAVIGADGARPVPVAPLDPLLRGLVGHVAAYEELAVEAAVRGGRRRVLAALLAHPLIGQYDLAGQLADRLIAENLAYLPWADAAAAR